MRIQTVLIANRGEIAVRVLRTVRALGLRSVVAHSQADADSLAVRLADDAVLLGAAPAAESYLSIDRILDAAKRTGADAIHPGYGFLAEQEAFARAVEENGLTFIGPSPENIAAMGNKIAARGSLAKAGVEIVAGHPDPVQDIDTLNRIATRVGFPLLLKAAAGGGGKGIRLVREAGDLEAAFRLARSEAENAFGDPTIFAERFLEGARHVEVQVIGDGRGGVRLYPERDCSIQRRHQKLLEESPCPALGPKQRERLLDAARRTVKLSKYRGAGTIEFLYDGDEGVYFLEMNTRLQVEHPLTEMLCGVDLVERQIAIAEGEELPGEDLEAVCVPGRGAALQFRVNAEDPEHDFAPCTGRLSGVHLPSGPGIRVDTAAFSGLEITPHYDSLLAKVIAWGTDRAEAVRRLRQACREISIDGVSTTLPVALALLDDDSFLKGETHCQFLESRLEDRDFLFPPASSELARALALAAAQFYRGARLHKVHETTRSAAAGAGAALSPWAQLGRTDALGGDS